MRRVIMNNLFTLHFSLYYPIYKQFMGEGCSLHPILSRFFFFKLYLSTIKSTTFVNYVCNIQYKMNDNKLKNKTVPFNYARCYNEQCPKVCNCLRRVAALLTTADTSYISIVNPMCIPATGIDCPPLPKRRKRYMWHGVSATCWTTYLIRTEQISSNN